MLFYELVVKPLKMFEPQRRDEKLTLWCIAFATTWDPCSKTYFGLFSEGSNSLEISHNTSDHILSFIDSYALYFLTFLFHHLMCTLHYDGQNEPWKISFLVIQYEFERKPKNRVHFFLKYVYS